MEDELWAAIKAMIEGQERAAAAYERAMWNASIKPQEWRVTRSIDAIHSGRKRHPIEWPS